MLLWLFYWGLIFLVGLCVGSFLNVVILRAFSGESIVLPPSKCPKCNERIKWYDNIPVLSYMVLQGKCRFCKEKINIQYPIVELVTGLSFVFICRHFSILPYGVSLTAIFMLIIASLSIVIIVTDIKEQVVFDVHTISFIVVALAFSIINKNMVDSLIGLVCAALIMELLARAGYLLVNKRAFGEGDTYIAAGIGALVGLKFFVLTLALSFLIQVLFILPAFIKKLVESKEYDLLFSFSAFLFLVISYKILAFKLAINHYLEWAFILSIIILGVYSCFSLIKSTKARNSFTYLPFGPSLLIAMFIVVFWSDAILKEVGLIF